MLNLVMAAAFQHVEMTNKISIRIHMRVFQGVAYACLCGQMNHAIKLLAGEKRCHAFPVGQLQLVKAEALRF